MPGRPVVFIGEMYDPSLTIGGGPVMPPAQPPGIWGGAPLPVPTPPIYYPPVQPPGIWGGGNVPMPTPPIYLPPVLPGGPPVVIWPSPGHPAHPIVLPPPPDPPEGGKPPPPEGGWGYHPSYGWGFFPPQDVAGPKK
jgi:hypothetical protein